MFYLPAFFLVFGYLSLIQAVLLSPSPRSLHRLSVRQQIPNVPDQCKSNCDPVNTLTATNCTPSQCCTDTFEREYSNCLRCVGMALNITDFTAAQQVLDKLFEECGSLGFTLPIPSALPGQDPNRQLSTSFPMSTTPISTMTLLVPTPTSTPAAQPTLIIPTEPPTNQFPSNTPNTNHPSVQTATAAPSGQIVPGTGGDWAVGNGLSLAGYITIFSSLAVGLYLGN